ncbi:DUF1778 domain-containing protein [Archangium primigenium]|uniref:type II toxin -antitoxin system TacA 1-like antitoxin n=1 Tax=[Archangium] primigenium TaxID=2792470 RepID=UPI001959319B|nr:DUF1778 domain-containing protein [Archangium primigenium]MBM7112085.1 DUF1778 domain-containing protein [Archangium primigenium]
MSSSYRLQATLPAPFETQLEQLRTVLEIDTSEVIKEALGFFAKAVLEARQGHRVAIVDEKQKVLFEYSSPSLTRLEWSARDERRIVLPDSDFDRLVDELEKPAKPSPRLRALAKRKSR